MSEWVNVDELCFISLTPTDTAAFHISQSHDVTDTTGPPFIIDRSDKG